MKKLDKFYIDGEFVAPHGTATLDLFNPVTNAKVAEVALGDAVDTQRAITAAKEALKTFSQTGKAERIEWLEKIHAALSRRKQDLIDVMVDEYGGTTGFCSMIMPASIDDFKEMAGVLRDFDFEPRTGRARTRLQPVGVVAVVIPWNMSNGFICTKLASALGAGCTVVIKPSELSAQQTQVMMECLHDAGLPKGVVNIVNGMGDVVGAELTRNPDVNKITFTGSTGVGKIIAKGAADTMKRVTLELGGKSPNIILDDADFAEAIPQAIFAAYLNSGQACAAATRRLVPAERLDEVNAIARATLENVVKVGDPKDPTVNVGPMVSRKQFERVEDYIRIGLEEGATLLAGGEGKPEGLGQGNFVKPTVFTNVKNSMRIAQEEIFGPVLSIIPYADEADAIAIANDTAYGLCSYVTSADKARAYRVAGQIDAGRVCVNNELHDPLAPFGGFKQSGFGREYGVFGLEAFLEPKAIIG
ncbi:aldehyde dehydrogenase [Kaistia sp. 32K]|uniref:aldehyde dehydrogenase family protein n=1 Tax=Kaistia sp. 32K TaxID=2795690 RepID=UPI001915BC1A|nr:aldehyde dehydrogenase family protein [Kaistia sp. 32K]BCP53975.1 aldehyde dehydrogenase [Kaistia sp. 32K]